MSGQEDFGPLLEVLVACVGVVDVISLFACMFNRKSDAKDSFSSLVDINNNDVRSQTKVDDKSPKIDLAHPIPHVLVDGIAPLQSDNDDVIESLVSKVIELEAKVIELEIKSRESSMERFIEIERYRRSRSPSPYRLPSGAASKDEETSSYDDETNTSSAESRASSVKHHSTKLITRDDEFRKTKRSSQISHESREEELMEFTKLEKEETENMDDYVPITYEGQDESHYRHGISPIQEVPSCPIHGDIERSPEPGMSSMTDKPWGDIKKDAAEIRKQEKKDQIRRSQSIDEEAAAEAQGVSDAKRQLKSVDVNEEFIRTEQNVLQQQHAKMLVKQAHVVTSEEQPEECVSDFEVIQIPAVEVLSEATSVNSSLIEINLSSPRATIERDTTLSQREASHESAAAPAGSRSSLNVVSSTAVSFLVVEATCCAMMLSNHVKLSF